jgi:small-conductance mechanosensitive channel
MDEPTKIIQFIRVGGLFTSLVVILSTWIVIQVLNGSLRRLGHRFADQRLRIQQAGTVLRFLLYLGSATACVLLSFRLTNELMLALGGSVAVMLGFGFKDLAASFIGGIIILFDRPFQVGDRVTFGGYYGEIAAIGLRSVRLTTLDDNLVTIPNNKFLTDVAACANSGALDMMVQMDFYIGLDQDIAVAKQIVADAITATRYSYLEKPYTVLINEVMLENHLAVRLRAKVYVLDVRYEKALETDVTERVLEGFRDAAVRPPAILHRSVVDSPESTRNADAQPVRREVVRQ